MGTAAGLIGKGFGHEAGKIAFFSGQLFHHEAEEGEPISHCQRVAVGEICFKLALGVFVVEGVYVPAQIVHGGDDAVDDFVVIEDGGEGVGSFGESVAIAHWRKSIICFFEDKELCFNPQVKLIAHRLSLFQSIFENSSAAGFERLSY